MRRKLITVSLVVFLVQLFPAVMFGHPGRTDKNGGHYVRTPGWGYEVGTYHYHNGGSSSDSAPKNSNPKKSTPKKATPKVTKPGAPEGVVATPLGNGQVQLTWNPVSGATSYAIYRSTKSNGGFKNIASTKQTSYIVQNLKPNRVYWFKVRAINKAGGTYSVVAQVKVI